jgi:hypothetical protein
MLMASSEKTRWHENQMFVTVFGIVVGMILTGIVTSLIKYGMNESESKGICRDIMAVTAQASELKDNTIPDLKEVMQKEDKELRTVCDARNERTIQVLASLDTKMNTVLEFIKEERIRKRKGESQ